MAENPKPDGDPIEIAELALQACEDRKPRQAGCLIALLLGQFRADLAERRGDRRHRAAPGCAPRPGRDRRGTRTHENGSTTPGRRFGRRRQHPDPSLRVSRRSRTSLFLLHVAVAGAPQSRARPRPTVVGEAPLVDVRATGDHADTPAGQPLAQGAPSAPPWRRRRRLRRDLQLVVEQRHRLAHRASVISTSSSTCARPAPKL